MMMPEIKKAHARSATFRHGDGLDRGPAYWLWLSLGLFSGSWLDIGFSLVETPCVLRGRFPWLSTGNGRP